MFNQIIPKTFIGTSDPVTLHHSLSYYGPGGVDTKDTTIERFYVLLDEYVDSHVGTSCKFKLSANITAGVALPSWAVSIKDVEGEITSDTMTVTLPDNTVMGGIFVGAMIQLHFSFDARSWQDGYPYWKKWHGWQWQAGHWNDWNHFEKTFDFDLIPLGVDFIYKLATLIPKFKIFLAIMPKGLLDHMQDTEHDLVDKDGLFLNPSFPCRWDLVNIGKLLVKNSAEVISLAGTPALAAVVTALLEFVDFLVSLTQQFKLLSIQFGPQLDFIFPLRVTITQLVAGYENDQEAFVYDNLTFSGNTITARNTSQNKITDGSAQLHRIGIHCKQTQEFPTVDVGVWGNFTLFWIFSASPFWDLHLLEILEKELGFDLGVGSYNSTMSNGIGGSGQETTTGNLPDTIVVKFT